MLAAGKILPFKAPWAGPHVAHGSFTDLSSARTKEGKLPAPAHRALCLPELSRSALFASEVRAVLSKAGWRWGGEVGLDMETSGGVDIMPPPPEGQGQRLASHPQLWSQAPRY